MPIKKYVKNNFNESIEPKILQHYNLLKHTLISFAIAPRVTLNLNEFLAPQCLAVWFMDMGYWMGRGASLVFYTQNLSIKCITFLRKSLKNFYNISTCVITCWYKTILRGYKITMSGENAAKFRTLINTIYFAVFRLQIEI